MLNGYDTFAKPISILIYQMKTSVIVLITLLVIFNTVTGPIFELLIL